MRPADSNQIRSIHLFRDMSDAHFAALVRAGFLQRFPAHVVLINEDEKPDFLHIVVEGSVELFSRHGRRHTTIQVLRPITTFILAAVVGDLPYLASARTLEPSQILMLPGEAVRSIFGEDAAFARAIVRELSRSFRQVMKDLKSQKLRSSRERLANWILIQDTHTGGAGRFILPYDKRTLASRLGTTPENLSRSLAQLASHGVTVRAREIIIRDKDQLMTLARPRPSLDDPDY